MATGDVIRLGSALSPRLIFQDGSTITTGTSGIQECSIKALCPDAQNVFNFIPKAGAAYDTVFGNNYLPNDFRVDYTGGGATINYGKGNTAEITLAFKRPDPATAGGTTPAPPGQNGRTVSVDSVINYKSLLDGFAPAPMVDADGQPSSKLGFPEPIVTVKYNTATPPPIAGGTVNALYALPTDPRASGFPVMPGEIIFPFQTAMGIGAVGSYWDSGTASLVSFGPTTAVTIFSFQLTFVANPLGWQLQRLKWDPVSGQTFYDVEEEWRGRFYFGGTEFVNKVP
jgi:hypothetical protein